MKSCDNCHWIRRLFCWTPCEKSINQELARIDMELEEGERNANAIPRTKRPRS